SICSARSPTLPPVRRCARPLGTPWARSTAESSPTPGCEACAAKSFLLVPRPQRASLWWLRQQRGSYLRTRGEPARSAAGCGLRLVAGRRVVRRRVLGREFVEPYELDIL